MNPIDGNFVLLRAGSLRLLLPQQDVGAAQYLEHELRPTREPGVFEHGSGQQAQRVLALSERLRPRPDVPEDRFLLASLAGGEGNTTFAWNEIKVLIDAQVQPQPLPVAMQVAGAPIDAYAEIDGELVLCTTAQGVLSFAATRA